LDNKKFELVKNLLQNTVNFRIEFLKRIQKNMLKIKNILEEDPLTNDQSEELETYFDKLFKKSEKDSKKFLRSII
jgi:conjugal transfer/entry exclusion protein